MKTKKPHFIIRAFLYLAFFSSYSFLVYISASSIYWLVERYFETQFFNTKLGAILAYGFYPLPWLFIFSVFAIPFLAALALKYFIEEKELYLNSMYKALKEMLNFFWYRILLVINVFKKTS